MRWYKAYVDAFTTARDQALEKTKDRNEFL